MTDAKRMYLQELALLSLVHRGEAHKKVTGIGTTIYKLDCPDPWTPTPPAEQRKVIPQVELHTGFQ